MKKHLFPLLLLAACLTTGLQAQTNKFRVDTLISNGPANKLIDLVFLAEGYTESELPKFLDDAKVSMEGFFRQEPFTRYREYFNVIAISSISNETGAGRTPDEPIDNIFGTCFGTNGSDRLLWPTKSDVVAAVLSANYPAYDVAALIVNSSTYGGAGGNILTFSTHFESCELFYHEFGHTFASLADEYWPGSGSEKANMTAESDPDKVKWKNWVGTDGVGVYPYEGGPEAAKWYRPHQGCRMRVLGVDYCDVCRETIVERIHSKVNCIFDFTPARNKTLNFNDEPMDFSIELLNPEPNTLKIEWLLDGEVYDKDKTTCQLDAATLASLDDKQHTFVASVEDTTAFVRVDDHAARHARTIKWNIKRDPKSGIEVRASEASYTLSSTFFTTNLTVTSREAQREGMSVQLVDLSGRPVLTQAWGNAPQCLLQTSGLPAAAYVLRVVTPQGATAYATKVVKR
ncbi:MAG: hypothetical protein IJ659_01385 [Alloprevotella sp.]|nr:hypothetical protein [Alloprevotella sp.]